MFGGSDEALKRIDLVAQDKVLFGKPLELGSVQSEEAFDCFVGARGCV
jgi:hypothetical protein